MTAVQQVPVSTIEGEETTLAEHGGKVLLVVNVASKCGFTPQYKGLEALYGGTKDRGFEVLGFPANDFGAQEPGTDEEIVEFCSTTYSVTFPMYSKMTVVGEDKHPLYAELTSAVPRAEGDPDAFREVLRGHGMTPNDDPEVLWNFEKFLIARDGTVVRRFASGIAPDDPTLVEAIETELNR